MSHVDQPPATPPPPPRVAEMGERQWQWPTEEYGPDDAWSPFFFSFFFVFGFVPLFFCSPPYSTSPLLLPPSDWFTGPSQNSSVDQIWTVDWLLIGIELPWAWSTIGDPVRLLQRLVSIDGFGVFVFAKKDTLRRFFVVVVVVVVVVLLKSAWICLAEVPDLDWIHRFFNGNGPTWNVKEESIGTTSLLMIFVSMNKSRGGWGGGFDFYD